ncbi:MAG: hypothetical protein CVU61_00785 [Deltaproteobacteria bacterium HGW-Deltaproteobacteria-19]|jgi:hypothetical protein|nr:MAG: hypothetical protein CVU61_00785 [Deltaproteobacteria bacterium HGW-Deltaproteobacteria-19]
MKSNLDHIPEGSGRPVNTKTVTIAVLLLSIATILLCVFFLHQGSGRLEAAPSGKVFCDRMVWQEFGKRGSQITIWKQRGYDVFFFETGMTIDADGSPHAYHPSNIGIDDNENGKDEQGNWVGIVLANKKPYIQNSTDPAPGYYVSATSLYDMTKRRTDPRRYVDSEKIPYIALPRQVMHPDGRCQRDAKACLGDITIVRNIENGRYAFAILADQAPSSGIGEGSIALATALGIDPDARIGGAKEGIQYLIFPGTGDEKPKSIEQINDMGKKILERWGGMGKLDACFADQS